MMRILAGISGICLFLVVSLAGAQGTDLKVAYVNMAKAIETSTHAEAVLNKLKAEFDPKDQKLTAQREKLKKIESELEKKALVLAESDRKNLEKDVRDMRRKLKRDTEEFREELNVRQNEELRKLERLVLKVVAKIAEAEKYDLIIHQGAIYASNRIDITDKVLTELSKTKIEE